MKKILSFIDDNILRFLVAFAILFIPLYPKLPSIGISHVWVYIRLEDFLIFVVALVWLIQLIRRKVSLPIPEGFAIAGYWICGLIALIYCLLFVAAHLQNFFPLIAALEYVRRIEYMILFFAAFSSVRKKSDIIFYLWTLGIAVAGITIYGFGQKFYPILWSFAPAFFKHYPFCFPAYLTGNEEFAKGTPFCLDALSRIASTFGGQYDLAAYLVFVVPIFVALFIAVRKWSIKILILLLVVFALEVLNFTSSRTSYAAYVLGVVGMLILWRKKLWIIPVLIVSIGVLFVISNSTLTRFSKTIQPVQIVQIAPGTSPDLQKAISKTQQTTANQHPQSPPPGTVTVGSGANLASGSAQVLTQADMQALEKENINISTISGSFLLKKAYALDISFTTRFQGEWPRDWQAFLSSPIFGTGYSSLTLASDNDYLRALGETGLVGAISFVFIFVIFGIYMKNILGSVKDPITRAVLFGLAGGTIGLLINAILIDVFEASKVAETYWILLGIGLGSARLYQKEPMPYKNQLIKLFTSNVMIMVYLFILIFVAFGASIGNFFVADDFVWLHWAATAVPSDLPKYFIQSGDFFYRPLAKVVTYFLYEIFSFQPQGYHLFILLVHFAMGTGVFFLAQKLSKNKLVGALTAMLFVLHPVHSENVFWYSGLQNDLGSLFILYMMLVFIRFREKKSFIAYILALLFAAAAFASYEIAVIIPFVLLTLDIFILKPKRNRNTYFSYLPFAVLYVGYFVIRVISHSFFGGGDYSYHLSRILPNIVGNFFGYTGIFLGGLPFLTFYNFLRSGLRSEWIYFTIVAVLLIAYLIWSFILYRAKLAKLLRYNEAQLIIFCLVFAFIALLPFLPLGNIAPRYIYLASFGYALALVILLRLLFNHIVKKPMYATASLIVLSLVLAIVYGISNIGEQAQWNAAGHTTLDTLLYFRKNYPSFSSSTDIYFLNVPVQQNNVWVFPDGLTDGLWFIYRDNLPQVHIITSLQDATNAANVSNNQNAYIFQYDSQGNINQVKIVL